MNGELSPMAKGLLTAAAFVVVVAGLKAAETVLVPFLLSVFIALIFAAAGLAERAPGAQCGGHLSDHCPGGLDWLADRYSGGLLHQ